MLHETCNELARNGLKKIVLVNGHGGNTNFLQYFCQAQLAERKGYSVILFSPESDPAVEARINSMRKTTGGGHADEEETSMLLSHRPDLAHVDLGKDQSGENLNRLGHLPFAYTGIWWYARYPNHYAGDGSVASKDMGELILNSNADQLVNLIKAVKKDRTLEKLQQRFFIESENPLKTKQ
jgi:creatinine amidohydrolase